MDDHHQDGPGTWAVTSEQADAINILALKRDRFLAEAKLVEQQAATLYAKANETSRRLEELTRSLGIHGLPGQVITEDDASYPKGTVVSIHTGLPLPRERAEPAPSPANLTVLNARSAAVVSSRRERRARSKK